MTLGESARHGGERRMANRVTSITEQQFSAKTRTMANGLDQGINNLVNTEIDKLCDEGVPDISPTHVADRVRQRLWKIDQLVNEGVLDSNATSLGAPDGEEGE
jgi:hypothetical protein